MNDEIWRVGLDKELHELVGALTMAFIEFIESFPSDEIPENAEMPIPVWFVADMIQVLTEVYQIMPTVGKCESLH